MWINPIYDRTQSDVSNNTSKGNYNYTDLNRIENNCAFLSNTLNSYGISISIITKTNWIMGEVPILSELDRIVSNVKALVIAFYTFENTPLPIDTMSKISYQGANDTERILYDINILIGNMVSAFKHCGTTYSGEGGLIR